MKKKILGLVSVLLLASLTIFAAGGFKNFSVDTIRFGGSLSGVRTLVFDETEDANSAKITVDPADENFNFNNQVNIANRLYVDSTDEASKPYPSMTEAQRDALTPANGDMVFNTTSSQINLYDGVSWTLVGGNGAGSPSIYRLFNAEDRNITDFVNITTNELSPINGIVDYSVDSYPASPPDVPLFPRNLNKRNTLSFEYTLASGTAKVAVSGGGLISPVEAELTSGDTRKVIEFTPTSLTDLAIDITDVSSATTLKLDDIVFSDKEKTVEWFIKNSAFTKIDNRTAAFIKTGASTASVKAGTFANVNGVEVTFGIDTAIVMPTLVAGTDYAIYICQDGTIRASDDFSAPAGYSTTTSTKVGGFHFSAVATTETVVGGQFATTGSGMIWTQPDVDKIRGINQFSFWDNKFRPKADDPRGMTLVAGQFWADIYFTNTDVDSNGTSKYGSDVASGTVLAKRPAMFGGDGTATYADGNWWNLAELVRSQGKRLPTFNEFSDLAFGTTEATSLGGASVTIPLTKSEKKYTSKWGVEQSTGHMYTWGADIGGYAGSSSWVANTNGRGSTYALNLSAPRFGGYRAETAASGSRSSLWSDAPTNSNWYLGVRAVCDHVITD